MKTINQDRIVVSFNGKYLIRLGTTDSYSWKRQSNWTTLKSSAKLFDMEKEADKKVVDYIREIKKSWNLETVKVGRVFSALFIKKEKKYVIVEDNYKSMTLNGINVGDVYDNGDYETEATIPSLSKEHLKTKLLLAVERAKKELQEAERLLLTADDVEILEDKTDYDLNFGEDE